MQNIYSTLKNVFQSRMDELYRNESKKMFVMFLMFEHLLNVKGKES